MICHPSVPSRRSRSVNSQMTRLLFARSLGRRVRSCRTRVEAPPSLTIRSDDLPSLGPVAEIALRELPDDEALVREEPRPAREVLPHEGRGPAVVDDPI